LIFISDVVVHEHGQKLWKGVLFLKNFRRGGVIKYSKFYFTVL
jgi:hypothetical protein